MGDTSPWWLRRLSLYSWFICCWLNKAAVWFEKLLIRLSKNISLKESLSNHILISFCLVWTLYEFVVHAVVCMVNCNALRVLYIFQWFSGHFKYCFQQNLRTSRLKGKITVLGRFINLTHITFWIKSITITILCSIGCVFHNNVSQNNVFQKQSSSSIKTNKPNSEK